MSVPQGYVCSLLSFPLSGIRPESVRVQTLRTVSVEGLVWVERKGLDTVQKAMDRSFQTQKRDTWWKLYFSSSAFMLMISVQNFWARMQLTTKSLVGLMCRLVILVPLYFFFPLTAWPSICLWGAWKIAQWHCSNQPMQSVLHVVNECVSEKTRLRTIHFTWIQCNRDSCSSWKLKSADPF